MTINIIKRLLFILLLMSMTVSVSATGTYQEPEEYIDEVFSGDVPRVSKLWVKKDLKEQIRNIMGHDLNMLRIKYWRKDARTVWILEEIGKDRPITAGIVINESRIESVNVLIFRESRGWEVRYPFFTDQFSDATLKENSRLDKHIDGISGATLSVKAMEKMARLALLLHKQTEMLTK
jgi:FMN-binding domain